MTEIGFAAGKVCISIDAMRALERRPQAEEWLDIVARVVGAHVTGDWGTPAPSPELIRRLRELGAAYVETSHAIDEALRLKVTTRHNETIIDLEPKS